MTVNGTIEAPVDLDTPGDGDASVDLETPGDGDAGDRALVLLVDDYKDCRDMYGAGLRFAGFRVVMARDGAEALQVARRAAPDLILMDLGLPGIDGCETTRLLKQDPGTAKVPVVALTAQPLPAGEPLHALGFEDVIIKPCLPDSLAEYVSRVLARHRRRRLAT